MSDKAREIIEQVRRTQVDFVKLGHVREVWVTAEVDSEALLEEIAVELEVQHIHLLRVPATYHAESKYTSVQVFCVDLLASFLHRRPPTQQEIEDGH